MARARVGSQCTAAHFLNRIFERFRSKPSPLGTHDWPKRRRRMMPTARRGARSCRGQSGRSDHRQSY
eukprot:4813445-Prymnesium_polylepis.1